MNIYVGNLPWSMTQDALRGLFEPFGEVKSASVIKDRETGQSKGFGFVEMADATAAQAAIAGLNGKDVEGRKLTVNEARPREARPPGEGGGRSGPGGRRPGGPPGGRSGGRPGGGYGGPPRTGGGPPRASGGPGGGGERSAGGYGGAPMEGGGFGAGEAARGGGERRRTGDWGKPGRGFDRGDRGGRERPRGDRWERGKGRERPRQDDDD